MPQHPLRPHPNQHIGVYKIGFSAEWNRARIPRAPRRREYEDGPPGPRALRAAGLRAQRDEGRRPEHPLEIPAPRNAGHARPRRLRPGRPHPVRTFFAQELAAFDTEELHPVGRQILECFKAGGSVEDYCAITPLGLAP